MVASCCASKLRAIALSLSAVCLVALPAVHSVHHPMASIGCTDMLFRALVAGPRLGSRN